MKINLYRKLGVVALILVWITTSFIKVQLANAACPKLSQASLNLTTLGCETGLNNAVSEARTHWNIQKSAVTNSPITDPQDTPVEFQIKVTEGPTSHILLATGQILVTNSGEQIPVLSSVVVNLQNAVAMPYTIATVTALKDITCRDGLSVEGAQTCFGQYQNSPSGILKLTDINNNDITALLGDVPIPPVQNPLLPCESTVLINFQAEFDLDQIGIQLGSPARIEVLTTFAGAGPRGKSSDNVSCTADANCNGLIEADAPSTCQLNESENNNVRTVKQRSTFVIPSYIDVCSSVLKTDPGAISQDVSCVTASTNSLSNAINKQYEGAEDLEQVLGTASCINYDCSTDITNSATLLCSDNRNELISGSPASASIQAICSAKPPKTISPGDFCSGDQTCWGTPSMSMSFCNAIRDNNYPTLVTAFANNFGLISPGGFLVGDIQGGLNGMAGGFAARWTTALAADTYLPVPVAMNNPGTLTADLNNPTSTSAGIVAGNLFATEFNKAADDAGLFPKNSTDGFEDLILQPCSNGFMIVSSLEGLTVKQLICIGNKAISGSAGCSGSNIPSCLFTVNPPDCGLTSTVQATLLELDDTLTAVNNNFHSCLVDHGCLKYPD